MRNRGRWTAPFMMLLGILALTTGCEQGNQKVDISQPAQYVGAAECKTCHEEIYKGWKSTFHPYKFKDADPDIIVADFSKNNTLEVKGYTNRMTRKGDDYFVTTLDSQKKENTYQVKYVIGGFWKQRFVTEFPNGALHILPVQWNVQTQEWVDYHGMKKLEPGTKKYWDHKGRTYQYNCTGCHNTGSKINHDTNTDTFRTTWSDKGVACEACHGPGSNHVIADIGDKAATIVNPAALPDPRRGAMVCGSCHNRGKSVDGKFGYPADYKPGGQLNFAYDEKPGIHPDGSPKKHHQQYVDWQNSGHEQSGVQCWDCHSPHAQGNSNKSQLKLPGNVLCNSCHQVEPQGVHAVHSVNNCIGCHMPNTAKTALPGDIRSHQMRVVPPQLSIDAGGLKKQPNSCNLCHYHEKDSPEDLQKVLNLTKQEELKKYAILQY